MQAGSASAGNSLEMRGMEDIEVCRSKRFQKQNMDLRQYTPDEVQKGHKTFSDNSLLQTTNP